MSTPDVEPEDLTGSQWAVLMAVLALLLDLVICGSMLVAEANGVW